MTLSTVTYDDSTHKICPIECTDDQAEAITKVVNVCGGISESIYNSAIAAAPEYQEPEHPLDTPLPCDIRIGAGTIKKGSKLSVLVARMNVLYQLAMKTQLGIGEPVNQEPTKDE